MISMPDPEHTSNEPVDTSKPEETEEVDHELEKIRMKRMQSVIQQKQRQAQQSQRSGFPSREEKIRTVLQVVMKPDAFQYYAELKDRNESVAQRIQGIILPPSVMAQLDLLITYLSQGMLRSNIIDKLQIQQLERKILGIGPRITVKKRDGEATDLNSFLKDQ